MRRRGGDDLEPVIARMQARVDERRAAGLEVAAVERAREGHVRLVRREAELGARVERRHVRARSGRSRRAPRSGRPSTPTPPTGGPCGRPARSPAPRTGGRRRPGPSRTSARCSRLHRPSSQHLKLEPGTFELNTKVAFVLSVTSSGPGADRDHRRQRDRPRVARRRGVDVVRHVDGAHEQLVRAVRQVGVLLARARRTSPAEAVEVALEPHQVVRRAVVLAGELEGRDRVERRGGRAGGDRRVGPRRCRGRSRRATRTRSAGPARSARRRSSGGRSRRAPRRRARRPPRARPRTARCRARSRRRRASTRRSRSGCPDVNSKIARSSRLGAGGLVWPGRIRPSGPGGDLRHRRRDDLPGAGGGRRVRVAGEVHRAHAEGVGAGLERDRLRRAARLERRAVDRALEVHQVRRAGVVGAEELEGRLGLRRSCPRVRG